MDLLVFMMEIDIQYCLALKKCDAIYDRVLIVITYAASDNYVTIKIDSYNALPLEKTLTLHNVIVLLKSVFNKVQINYYYNIYLEKCFYQLAKK